MGESEPFFWVEEYNGEMYTPMVGTKRKARMKKMEFVGWGSRPLIEFLESMGVDTSKKISQYDATDIITKYVNDNNLHHKIKKKRIQCDDSLLSLFGRKTISRIKIYELLETHFAENQVESDDDFIFSSEEEDNGYERQRNLSSVRKTVSKKRVLKVPKSNFAAIVSDNIKLIYLKRSLVEDLLKDRDSFEAKIVGSFVRIKSDPNDYLQKNSHLLVQVMGFKKASGTNGESAEVLLQVSNFIKDVRISMLSNDNFSEAECEDLRQRVRDGLLKKPTIGEFEEKVRVLHEDVTKHWLVGEIALLQKRINQANEKGWRRELFEYMERKQMLQTPEEQSRLLHEIPEVIAEDIEVRATLKDYPDETEQDDHCSPKSTLSGASDIPVCDKPANGTSSTWISFSMNSAGSQPAMVISNPNNRTWSPTAMVISKPNNGLGSQAAVMISKPINETGSEASVAISKPINESGSQAALLISKPKKEIGFWHGDLVKEQQKQPTHIHVETNGETQSMKAKVNKGAVVIDLLSDDEEEEDIIDDVKILDYNPESSIWHYADPQGDIQGPFPILSLKRWKDSNYFPPDFKIWRTGQSEKEAVLLTDVINWVFSN